MTVSPSYLRQFIIQTDKLKPVHYLKQSFLPYSILDLGCFNGLISAFLSANLLVNLCLIQSRTNFSEIILIANDWLAYFK